MTGVLFKKALYEVKVLVNTYVLIYFGRLRLEYTMETNFITLQTVDPEIRPFLIFDKTVCE